MPEPDISTSSELDAAFQPLRSRYVVGIDLGTTNSAVAFVDTRSSRRDVGIFRVEQLSDFGATVRSDTLPSFHYELTDAEAVPVDARFRLGKEGEARGIVGILARERTLQVPGRGIGSAKSWLCHNGIDRASDLLPWHGDADVPSLSPVEVSRRYLEHMRRQWDRDHPHDLLRDQEVIVTLPASFDEVARQLTLEAAKRAGLQNVVLIEEPQAAFYAWLHAHESSWMNILKPGQSILVCDIGGGTTDFTLIRVIDSAIAAAPVDAEIEDPSKPGSPPRDEDQSRLVSQKLESVFGLHRVAVGEHLMLGGDNLDLTLAKHLEQQLLRDMPGVERLSPRQWDTLKAHARKAKESLLQDSAPESYSISMPSSGSKLIAGNRNVVVDGNWARTLLIEGFFGHVPLESRPDTSQEGFQEFGLPYEQEPNVHKHLAQFLWDHRWAGRSEQDRGQLDDRRAARPDWVLFNGGVLESSAIREAVLTQIAHWFADAREPDWKPGALEGNRLDLAVAQGAAYFGLVRRGEGVRIDARLARSYYLLVRQEPSQAICVMPASALPLDRYRLDSQPFELTLGEPVRFPLYCSSSQLTHAFGELIDVDENTMSPLPPVHTVLTLGRSQKKGKASVHLESELSEIGTLAMSVVTVPNSSEVSNVVDSEGAARWNLEFDVRSVRTEDSMLSDAGQLRRVVDASMMQSAAKVLDSIFGEEGREKPKECYPRLTDALGLNRRDWPIPLLRELWRYLAEHSDSRKRSTDHEARWLNLAGWALRPGFGYPADDWRVQTTWRLIHNKLMHRSASSVAEGVILWRRIAGGFTEGQQNALFQDTWSRVKPMLGGATVGREQLNTNVSIELLRLLGSLERLQAKEKILAGDLALSALSKKKLEPLHHALLWMVGRMGCRVPVYASLQQTIPIDRVVVWIEKLLAMEGSFTGTASNSYSLALMLLSRRTGDRYRDIPSVLRERVLATMRRLPAPELHLRLVEQGGALDEENTMDIVGDTLPLGFALHGSH